MSMEKKETAARTVGSEQRTEKTTRPAAGRTSSAGRAPAGGRGKPASGKPGSARPGSGKPGEKPAYRKSTGGFRSVENGGKPFRTGSDPRSGEHRDGTFRGNRDTAEKSRTPGEETVRSGETGGKQAGGSAAFRWDGHRGGANGGMRGGAPGRRPDRKAGPAGRPAGRFERKEKPAVEGLESRRTALQVIRKVTEEGAYASLALDAALKGSGLSAADRRLVTRLVYDTLDNLIRLDHVLGQVMAREDTDIRLRNILRLGACQVLLEDRIPESAATNTSVQLCVELGMEGLKGVCNGILRNLIRKKDELEFPERETEPDRWASIQYSLPEWLWRRLREDYGAEEAEKIVSFRREETITIRPNLAAGGEEALEKALEKKIWGKEKGRVPHAWHITGAMNISRDADFLQGVFSIQSESSMMAAMAVAPGRGKQVLDCCAAPGGKTCLLAEMMGGTGRVQAWDLHEHRTALIEAQARRLGLDNVRPVTRDATKVREDLTAAMDAVLLDAPCSGLGVLAEKPDIKLRVTEESVQELTGLQKKLLDAVCGYVKPGGTLVYSTCSLLKDENERQAAAFLERHPEFEAVKLPETIPEEFRRHEGLGLQLLPHRDGVEGFYICRMRRREDA